MYFDVNCKYFRGDVPCKPHKQEKLTCTCKYFEPVEQRILIIKLGAIGDVIRTTPLLRKLKKEFPRSEISWVTHTPDVVPRSYVKNVYTLSAMDILILQAEQFDYLYNLDKDKEACALANLISAKVKKGFFLKNGICAPIDKDAEHKFWTGLDDELNKINTYSYPEEIFSMVGFKFSKEKYILEYEKEETFQIPSGRKIIGLNTGCGNRWQKRLWPTEYWIELARRLKVEGHSVVLLGGPQEDEKNKMISEKTGTVYFGFFRLQRFMQLMDQCDVIVTAVSMAMHIAIALEKKMVLFVNTFPKAEFELYGLGKVIQPNVPCLGCFTQSCDLPCMELVSVDLVMNELQEYLD